MYILEHTFVWRWLDWNIRYNASTNFLWVRWWIVHCHFTRKMKPWSWICNVTNYRRFTMTWIQSLLSGKYCLWKIEILPEARSKDKDLIWSFRKNILFPLQETTIQENVISHSAWTNLDILDAPFSVSDTKTCVVSCVT